MEIREGKKGILSKEEVKNIETGRLNMRNLEQAVENGEVETYEYFENLVIKKEARVEFKKTEDGFNSANIIKKDPATQKEEIIYHTTQVNEVNRLKAADKGITIIVNN